MKFKKSIHCALIPVFIILLSSCASTHVTSTWKDKNYTLPVQNVLVIGLAASKIKRRLFEDTLSAAFKKDGIKAEQSANYFNDIREISKKSVAPLVKENKFDAVIVARVVSVTKEKRFVPSNYPPSYSSFYGYYGSVGNYYYQKGHYVEDTVVSLEVNLYETANARLVWAITTETFFPDKIDREITKLTKIITSGLKKEGLLKK